MQIPSLRSGRVSAVETARLTRAPEPAANWTEATAAPADEVLPRFADMRVRSQNGARWLEVDADAAALWPKMRDFWQQAGIDVVDTEPELGIMQTGWVVPRGQGLSAEALRDSFRLRLERRDADTTSVYITHRGAMRTAVDGANRWVARPPDPGLEAEYLTRLMVYLGEPRPQAERLLTSADRSAQAMHLDRVAGIPVLVVKDEFRNVWPLTGVALDRAGLPVEDEDIVSGTYYFRYLPATHETEGVLTGVSDEHGGVNLDENGRYQVHLLDQPGQTLITAQSAARQSLAPAAAEEILSRLIASMQNGSVDEARMGAVRAASTDGV
jgi:outer membrane protein assembly factor BamC